MKTLKLAILSVAITCLFGMNSQAEITSLSTSAYLDYGSGGALWASLTANKDIYVIDWYIDGSYIKTTDHYQSPTRSSGHVYLDTRTGGIKGVKYEVKAVAWFSDLENNTFISDTATADVTVLAPAIDSGLGPNSGFWGHAEVTRHYFNGTAFVMEASASATNPTNKALDASAWFRQQKFVTNQDGTAGGLMQIERDPHIDADLEYVEVKAGDSFSDSVDSMVVEINHGGEIGDGERVWLDAHTHLQVTSAPTDDWEADTGVHLFTKDDNP